MSDIFFRHGVVQSTKSLQCDKVHQLQQIGLEIYCIYINQRLTPLTALLLVRTLRYQRCVAF